MKGYSLEEMVDMVRELRGYQDGYDEMYLKTIADLEDEEMRVNSFEVYLYAVMDEKFIKVDGIRF